MRQRCRNNLHKFKSNARLFQESKGASLSMKVCEQSANRGSSETICKSVCACRSISTRYTKDSRHWRSGSASLRARFHERSVCRIPGHCNTQNTALNLKSAHNESMTWKGTQRILILSYRFDTAASQYHGLMAPYF